MDLQIMNDLGADGVPATPLGLTADPLSEEWVGDPMRLPRCDDTISSQLPGRMGCRGRTSDVVPLEKGQGGQSLLAIRDAPEDLSLRGRHLVPYQIERSILIRHDLVESKLDRAMIRPSRFKANSVHYLGEAHHVLRNRPSSFDDQRPQTCLGIYIMRLQTVIDPCGEMPRVNLLDLDPVNTVERTLGANQASYQADDRSGQNIAQAARFLGDAPEKSATLGAKPIEVLELIDHNDDRGVALARDLIQCSKDRLERFLRMGVTHPTRAQSHDGSALFVKGKREHAPK